MANETARCMARTGIRRVATRGARTPVSHSWVRPFSWSGGGDQAHGVLAAVDLSDRLSYRFVTVDSVAPRLGREQVDDLPPQRPHVFNRCLRRRDPPGWFETTKQVRTCRPMELAALRATRTLVAPDWCRIQSGTRDRARVSHGCDRSRGAQTYVIDRPHPPEAWMKTTATGPCTIADHGTGVRHASGTAGDATAACEGLVRGHSGPIDHAADAVTRDIHDAQDRTHDVLLRVPRHRGSYQSGASGVPLDQLLVDPVFDDDVLDALTAASPSVRVIVLSLALRGCGVERIGLKTLGIKANGRGIHGDAHLRPGERLRAVGDVTGIWPSSPRRQVPGRRARLTWPTRSAKRPVSGLNRPPWRSVPTSWLAVLGDTI